ncbi:MAG: hypothetical protein LQ350_005565 [Teloschistes chrysophthalmus]|nr:MAG: hypothetical protein LQ350_005565 [Niorma chrysophthalma]
MYALTLTADLSGVTDLLPLDIEAEPFFYTFKIQCTSCRETHPNAVSISRFEKSDISGSKGEANFVWRCKACKRESTATLPALPTPYNATSQPTRQTILVFDCRGLEFIEFVPVGEFTAHGAETNTKFTGIDLSEGEWFDYDEKAGEEVSVKDLKWEIRRV